MAGIPPDATKWKPGQSGNPAGRPPGDPIMDGIKRLTAPELADLASLIVKGSIDELKGMAKDPNSTVLQAMVSSVAVKIMSKGDMHALDLLLNRLVGKVKDRVEHTGNINKAPQVVVTLPSNGREGAKPDAPRND